MFLKNSIPKTVIYWLGYINYYFAFNFDTCIQFNFKFICCSSGFIWRKTFYSSLPFWLTKFCKVFVYKVQQPDLNFYCYTHTWSGHSYSTPRKYQEMYRIIIYILLWFYIFSILILRCFAFFIFFSLSQFLQNSKETKSFPENHIVVNEWLSLCYSGHDFGLWK